MSFYLMILVTKIKFLILINCLYILIFMKLKLKLNNLISYNSMKNKLNNILI